MGNLTFETCDRCGFRAYVWLVNEEQFDLTLCKHHFEQHEVALMAAGWAVLEDERAELLAPIKEEVPA